MLSLEHERVNSTLFLEIMTDRQTNQPTNGHEMDANRDAISRKISIMFLEGLYLIREKFLLTILVQRSRKFFE